MLVNPNKHPSFCKILFEEAFVDKILMPPAFIKEHNKMLAKTCILKVDPGMSWTAKIVREESNFFMCEGDWPQFVVHHKLELGDILLFFLIDKSTFLVMSYNKECSKNLCGQQVFEELSGSSSEEEEDIRHSRKIKKVKIEPIELSNSKEGRVDPSSGTKYGEGDIQPSGKSGKVKMEPIELLDSDEERVDPSCRTKDRKNSCESVAKADDDMLGVKEKALGLENPHAKYPDKSKRPASALFIKQGRNPNKPTRPSDSEEESSSDSEEESSSDPEYDVFGDMHIKKSGRMRGESYRMHKKQSKSASDEIKTIMDKESSTAYQRAREHALKSKNPCDIYFMQPSYISEPYVLNINSTFAWKYFGEHCDIMLRVPGRRSWSVKCNMQKRSKAGIGKGWRAFARDNELKLGDVCVFEVMKGSDEPLLDVTIFRAAGQVHTCP